MWTSGQRKKLQEDLKHYEAVIVLGCKSATETVGDAVKSTDCKVIEGMDAIDALNTTGNEELSLFIHSEGLVFDQRELVGAMAECMEQFDRSL